MGNRGTAMAGLGTARVLASMPMLPRRHTIGVGQHQSVGIHVVSLPGSCPAHLAQRWRRTHHQYRHGFPIRSKEKDW